MTTFEPGERLVLTQGLAFKPLAAALRASNAAPSITDGFDVLVQLVMAAMSTAPSLTSKLSLPATLPTPFADGFFLARSSAI